MSRENLLQTRRGTAQTWTSINPTLAEGEAGFETDTKKFKIGDGFSAWNDLKYISCDGGSLDENLITGSTLGSITLSNMFNTAQPMMKYEGITGSTIKVPPGYDHAIYIDSQGNVTEEIVNQGQTLTFKSQIVTGKAKKRAGSQAVCTGSCSYIWKDGWWQWQSSGCKCTSNCTPSGINNFDCSCDPPDAYDTQGRPTRMPIAGRPPWTGPDKPVYPTPNGVRGSSPGEVKTTPCYCRTCLPAPRASWSFKCSDPSAVCGLDTHVGLWVVETKCPDGWAPEVDRIQIPPNGQSCCQVYEEPCYNLESGNNTGPIGGNYPPV